MTTQGSKVILVGPRATGKTTIGKKLAQNLSMEFLDMDKLIENDEGRTIREMVATDGWLFFRTKEQKLLERLVKVQNVVIATGGGAILHQEIWPKFKRSGLVVWLSATPETIFSRIRNDSKTLNQRPSLTGAGIISETAKIMSEREPLYRAGSHLQVATEHCFAHIVKTVTKEWKKYCHCSDK